MKGAALRSHGVFQGEYQASAAVNKQPSWTSKDHIIWYGFKRWFIGDGKHAVIYSLSYHSFPYDKKIQWYFNGKELENKKFKPNEIDINCTMKAGEPVILKYKCLF